jgi:chromosome segregation ATPase
MQNAERLDQIMQTLEDELDKYGELIESLARAEAKYKSLKAKEWFVAAKDPKLKTVGDKTAFIDDQLENEYLDYKLAEGRCEAAKERTRTLRAILSATQTLNSLGRV